MIENVDATDEALYANTEFLEREQAAVDILVEELVRTWREINQNPGVVVELRAKYNLLPDLPAELEAEVVPYFEGSVASGAFPNNGGGAEAAKADFEFNALAGKLEGDPATPGGRGLLGARAAEPGRRQARAGLSGATPRRAGGPAGGGRRWPAAPELAVAAALGRGRGAGLGDRRAHPDQLRLPDLLGHHERLRRPDASAASCRRPISRPCSRW